MAIDPKDKKMAGIVLSGGGARGAYQAGVVRALTEIAAQEVRGNPFQIITGISAGAINASYLAMNCNRVDRAGKNLAAVWSNLTTDQIVSINPLVMGKIGLSLMKQLSFGAITKKTPTMALLNTDPLEELLRRRLRPERIQKRIDEEHLYALAVTATDYNNSHARSFVQAREGHNSWARTRRESVSVDIGIEHVMASSAIPVLFPPHKIDKDYHGDGGVRNMAPLSPALKLGAEKLIIVGVRRDSEAGELHNLNGKEPSLARIFSVLVNGMLMDAVDIDVERLQRLNEVIRLLDKEQAEVAKMRVVDHLWISPSRYLGEIALKWVKEIPARIRYLLQGLGPEEEAVDLISYLLFEKGYCQELVELGYSDTMARRAEVVEFYNL